jgi:uncharacterized protein (UPF0276 family)
MGSWVGAGIGYRRTYRAALAGSSDKSQPAILEVMPDHFFSRPWEIDELGHVPLVFHDVGLSIGTASGPADLVTRARLERLRELVRRAKPLGFSDHLAITRSPSGIDLGHLCPVLPNRATLAIVRDHIHAWQDLLEVPIALENIAHPFELTAQLDEAELFSEIVAATGCGMLLDLTNLVLDGKNFGFDPVTRLERYPLESVWQVHLAGGVRVDGFWIDSHGAPVGRAELDLLGRLRRRARALRTIVIERDENLPPLSELLAEAREAERIWCDRPETETRCQPI